MVQPIIRRRAIKAGALLAALFLGGIMTTAIARLASGLLVAQDTGTLGKTIARNLAGSKADIEHLAAGKPPSPDFNKTLQRAINGEAIFGYQLLDARGNTKFEIARPTDRLRNVGQFAASTAQSQKMITKTGWQDTSKGPTSIGSALIPIVNDGKTVAVHAISFDQT
jgi:hypothetical protein